MMDCISLFWENHYHGRVKAEGKTRESRLAFAAISTRDFCFCVLGSIDCRLTSSCAFLRGAHWLAAWRDTSLFPQHVRLERNDQAPLQEGDSFFSPVPFLKKTIARPLCLDRKNWLVGDDTIIYVSPGETLEMAGWSSFSYVHCEKGCFVFLFLI